MFSASTPQDTPKNAVIATTVSSPYIAAYAWDDTKGFGAKYNNPTTIPLGAASIARSPNGQVILLSNSGASKLDAYKWSVAFGFGAKYSDPSTPVGIGLSQAVFTKDGLAIVGVSTSSPYIVSYVWSNTFGFGSRYSNPSVLPSTSAISVDTSYANDAVVLGLSGSPYIEAYRWNVFTGFGIKYSNPSPLLPFPVFTVKFTNDGLNVVTGGISLGSSTSSGAYQWTYASGFGSFTAFSPLPTGNARALAITESSLTGYGILVGTGSSSYLYSYRGISNQSTPTTVIPGAIANLASVTFSSDTATTPSTHTYTAFAAHNTTPYISAYQWTKASGFGTKYTDPSILPNANGRGVVFI